MTLTMEKIKEQVEKNQAWLERGILAIYDKQTQQEKRAEHTIVHNGVGFNGPDAGYLSYVARYLQSGRHLSGHHIDKARKRMLKYSGQLLEIAKEKANES